MSQNLPKDELDQGVNQSELNYSELSYYLHCLETMDLTELFRQLLNYLKCLTSDASEQFLPEIQRQLQSEHSWLAKASLIAELPGKLQNLDELITQTPEDSAQHITLSDAKRRLEYISQAAGEKLLEDIGQIYTGVHILLNEKLPLNEVRTEVSEYLKEQNIQLSTENTAAEFEAILMQLNTSSIVNSLRLLAKQIKPLPIQTDLFIKRFLSSSQDHATQEKLDIQFKANKYRADQLMLKIKALLKQARERLSEKLVARLSRKISTLTVAKVVQSYVTAEKTALIKAGTPLAPTTTPASAPAVTPTSTQTSALSSDELELQAEQRRKQQLARDAQAQELKQAEDLQRAKEETKALEVSILQAEMLVKNIQVSLGNYQAQINCANKLKACYKRFSLVYLSNNIAQKLDVDQSELNACLSQMDQAVHWSSLGLTEEQSLNMQVMQKEARTDVADCLEKTQDYLRTLDIENQAENTINIEIHDWQGAINQMILSADLVQLTRYIEHLEQIKNISNEYLRAILIVRYSKLNIKISQAIIKNMTSWSVRFVDKAVVVNTLSYLGIKLSEKNLLRACPEKIAPYKKHHISSCHRASAWFCLYEDCFFGVANQCENFMSWLQNIKLFSNSKR